MVKYKIYNILIVIVVLLVIGCSGYEKLLKSSDNKKKYDAAMEFYAEEDYSKAITLFEQIANVYRGTVQADTVFFYQAMSYFNQGNYIMAVHYFEMFSRTYTVSPFAVESDFMIAYSYYLMSPRPELDQENTKLALQNLQLFLMKHPEDDRVDDCKKYIAELRNKLVEKSFLSARLYFDMEDYKAAIVALNNALLEYPESKYREEISYMLLKSSYLYAENSIKSKQKERYQEAADEYYSFASEFPKSEYLKEAQRIFGNLENHLDEEYILEN